MLQEFGLSINFNEIESQNLVIVVSQSQQIRQLPKNFPQPPEQLISDLMESTSIVYYPENQPYQRIFFLRINLKEDPLRFPIYYKVNQKFLAFQYLGQEIYKVCKNYKIKTINIFLQETIIEDFNVFAYAFFGVIILSRNPYKEIKKQQENKICQTIGIMNSIDMQVQEYIFKKLEIYKCNLRTTRLANSRIGPNEMVNIVQAFQLANEPRVTIMTIQGEELEQQGYNLLYSVGKGAIEPPALVHLKFMNNPNSDLKISLVGKGITYDAGGINIKSSYLTKMHLDKTGACVMFNVFQSAVQQNLPVNLTVTLSIAENAVDAKSYKPGQIIKSKSGKTVEVTNTDAEGRLALADAFTFVQQTESPDILIDVATLTTGPAQAFGYSIGGIIGNDDELIKQIQSSGEAVNEIFVNLPVLPEHVDSCRGSQSDLVNAPGGYSGCIKASVFLWNFIQDPFISKQIQQKKVRWVHLDIAGPMLSEENIYGSKGFGAKTLMEWIQRG